MVTVVMLLCIVSAHAEDYACGNSILLTRYIMSVDPSKITDGTCTVISKGNTVSQRALVTATPQRYLKVIGGLATEMTVAEKGNVDAAIATLASARQVFVDEIAQQDICSQVTLADIDTKFTQIAALIQADIDNVTLISAASSKQAMTTIARELGVVVKKIARCVLSRSKVR